MKQYKYKINGNLYNVTVNDIEENIARVEVNGTPYTVEIDKPVKAAPKPVTRPASAPKTSTGAPVVARPAATSSKSGIKSPLPGVILDIKVKEGDTVKKGQLIAILEAMKMENNINADKDGVVSAVKVNKGDSVLEGTDLIIIE
ncbi:MAG: acetyl-CoA carboxylase biotin carboxyl carrier protein [Bacteroides graminisolvens]|jgi:glutaconyl-CoA/methylmalonyl-CoA decarboxylase subunit gamma|uniref:Biotin carboxyl carrier protein of methylmalonyl-CoA decarboxylase n=1 Tax=Bacteroides graminisolvens DSM 19988 = JCM 15093 TaxID=1121097 RepID=A0A069D6G3_9BACE|nr:biotin/lipoyl-containing protein [Bacteroides graminisolvens]MBP6139646.1 biotin/lipoyl-binding protein [Bacteroides sp.]MBP6248708.1 biotin/lipoyl-binding protein [Bacteroides sp.]MBP6980923.1 biotin/lipoyl-binding protein [Bacteroides sp.]MBP7292987.1 biotin/lipoyl-binding protein [Bacteroides sp.]MBP9496467.1 biotin/lipoyl-binding protein [Bacteroides sp.]